MQLGPTEAELAEAQVPRGGAGGPRAALGAQERTERLQLFVSVHAGELDPLGELHSLRRAERTVPEAGDVRGQLLIRDAPAAGAEQGDAHEALVDEAELVGGDLRQELRGGAEVPQPRQVAGDLEATSDRGA
ncbi:MAG: hypothetical protein ACTIJK_09445 [Brachybacterium sp.]